MHEFIREAGWGMWPVLIFGALAIGTAIRYALGLDRTLLPVVVGFSVVTVIGGFLGPIRGVQNAIAASGDGLGQALRESLNCAVAAFVLVALAALLAMIGSYRRARLVAG